MDEKTNNLLDDIEKQGWSVQESFFSSELLQQLKDTLDKKNQQGKFQSAGIGRENNFHVEKSIRSDKINWFDEQGLSECQKKYMDILQQLQDKFNQQFYFGLTEFEVHFALYEKNAFYARHLDQHKNQDTRVLTVITYLNENWKKEDGGELCLYLERSLEGSLEKSLEKNLESNKKVIVIPNAGTLVCFLSADFEHEVLPAKRARASLTSWFRKRL